MSRGERKKKKFLARRSQRTRRRRGEEGEERKIAIGIGIELKTMHRGGDAGKDDPEPRKDNYNRSILPIQPHLFL